MSPTSNVLKLDMRDNPDLKAALGGLEPGSKLSLEFELMVNSVDDESFEASIESIVFDGEAGDDETPATEPISGEVTPTAEQPVAAAIMTEESDGDAEEDEDI